ncbi:bile acid:sodium symporter family protein [Thiohalobacter sp. IOR34]|uniref:bile acid:sodium symporter family protein n=1 Tax=Thiohalobacter sp. IOR34 TaxID=3057176 RepID=UPI0025B18C1E|nr:bile acid:sodium symporter family protein [Thiohalobacter sp. IOR34]WJW75610.1 bile acid:sodium symporter family protein [Thiohalobacter sp. IOR34]
MAALLALSRLIANQLAPLTLLGAVAAYLHPPLFLVFRESFLWFFAATMFALGVVLEPRELRATLREPGRIGLGVLTQYTVMPLLGLAAALLMPLPDAVALGFIIVACAPGAMASNVIVYLAGGAVAYSVSLTTVATLLSPLLTPALVKWLGGVFLPIPFWPMMQTILWTVLLPLLAGLALRRLLGARLGVARELAPAIAALAIVVICSYAVAANQGRIAAMGPLVMLTVIAVNGLGYAAGWWLARRYGFDRRHRLTLAIEIGMQNAGLGVALALRHFTPETALPGALFAVWCILTAAGASAFLRRRAAVMPTVA